MNKIHVDDKDVYVINVSDKNSNPNSPNKSNRGISIHLLSDSLLEIDKNGDGVISPEELNEFVNNLVAKQTNGLNLSNNKNSDFAAMDTDGDGQIDENELLNYVQNHKEMMAEKSLLTKGAKGMFILLILFSFIIGGLTYVTIELSKETNINTDVMISKTTGNAIQCANTDFIVVNGTMVSRVEKENIDNNQKRRRLAGDNEFTAETINALGVRNIYNSKKLSSTMPDKYFKELEWLELQSKSGAMLTLKILAIARIPHSKANCGTFLKISTISGILILDDNDVYYDNDVTSLFIQAGYQSWSDNQVNSGDTTHLRRLLGFDSKNNHQKIRKLDASSTSIVGFFNSIENDNWTCESVQKPSFPTVFSSKSRMFDLCENGDKSGHNLCAFQNQNNYYEVPGVVSINNIRYLSTNRESFVTVEKTVVIDYPPHHGGLASIMESNSDGLMRYQIGSDGAISNCFYEEGGSIKMSLPDDYIFYFLPDEQGDSSLRRYRISYQIDEKYAEFVDDPHEWYHIDYFEDKITNLPKVLLTPDGSILQIDDIKLHEDAIKFQDTQFQVSQDDFNKCLIITNVSVSNRYNDIKNDFNITKMSNKHKLINESWNDWDKPYPPLAFSPPLFKSSTLNYYLTQSSLGHTRFNSVSNTYEAITSFGKLYNNHYYFYFIGYFNFIILHLFR